MGENRIGMDQPTPPAENSPIGSAGEAEVSRLERDELKALSKRIEELTAERDEARRRYAGSESSVGLLREKNVAHQKYLPKAHEALSVAEARILSLEAEVKRKDEALTEADELLQQVRENLGEGIHTALRKGVDGKGSAAAWTAIANMTGNGWPEALAWFSEVVGLDPYLRKRAALQPQEGKDA